MITVTETLHRENRDPVMTRKKYQFDKKEFIQILKKQFGLSGKDADELKKTNEVSFSYAGIKRKIQIKEDELEVANGSKESI